MVSLVQRIRKFGCGEASDSTSALSALLFLCSAEVQPIKPWKSMKD